MATSANILHDPNNMTAAVYRFSVERTGQDVTGLTYNSAVAINCPRPQIHVTNPVLCDHDRGYTSAITSITENPADGTLYITGLTFPKFAKKEPLSSQINSIFTTPMLAAVPSGAAGPIDASVITGSDLALPLSIIWTGGLTVKCGGADIAGSSGKVDFEDFALLASQWQQTGTLAADIAPLPNGDDVVDLEDLAAFAEHWLDENCN